MSNDPKNQLTTADVVSQKIGKSIQRRQRKERNFKWLGRVAIGLAVMFLVILFAGILTKGIPGMFQHFVTL